ncbi:CRISPR-associated endonuclease Cas2 [Leadbettera azotonutricia]|uniref:CRISPR-associated endoribonuclease Cas2 n=1 Tax=Leadbettera azotonutricia (strain ATCC BAA-888 / DSM 13862 / ZAS-9) TaxID=545695 RepID=F5YD08_LEAAZ|nr:CRISPR-associated endonuclease Cas2 [Leadbettera azotonutricia]AEF81180.1 CRISPR-associated protein Cas2 [Leadbettera azotonutricia ZAS-9]
MTYLFAYDISDCHRRNLVAKKLEQFGFRIQRSIFQCDVSPSVAEDIKLALRRYINEKEDSLLIYPLCADCLEKACIIGNRTLPPVSSYEIL